jgi:hypothetical protein
MYIEFYQVQISLELQNIFKHCKTINLHLLRKKENVVKDAVVWCVVCLGQGRYSSVLGTKAHGKQPLQRPWCPVQGWEGSSLKRTVPGPSWNC